MMRYSQNKHLISFKVIKLSIDSTINNSPFTKKMVFDWPMQYDYINDDH